MNIENIIIFINDEDKTEEVVDCYQIKEDKIEIKLNNGESKIYSNSQVKWSTKYAYIKLEDVVIYENGIEISNILKVITFDEFEKIRIIFKNGSNKLYSKGQLYIKDNGLDEPVVENNFMYLREISKQLDLYNGYDGVGKIFEDISVINPNSALVNYLNPKSIETGEDFDFEIYPFGFNLNQNEAVKKALNSKINIIQSSSITEKTEVILNVAATAVLEGKNVVIVTKDNFSALKYLEILKKSDIDFIVNDLKENETSDFQNNCEQWLRNSDSKFMNENIPKIKADLVSIQNELVKNLENQARVEILEMHKSYLLSENSSLEKSFGKKEVKIPAFPLSFSPEKLLDFREEYSSIIKKQGQISFLQKIIFIFKYSILDFGFYNIKLEILERALNEVYNNLKIDETDEEIKLLKSNLDKSKLNSEMEKIKEKSMEALKCGLYEAFKNNEAMNTLNEEGEKGTLKEKRNHPILTSAVEFFINSTDNNSIFDYVILDEASNMDIVTGALAFARGRNIIIIDDLNERQTELDKALVDELMVIFDKHQVNSGYKYLNNSLISSLNQVFKQVPKTVLSKKYKGNEKNIGYNTKKLNSQK
ncbi:MULTISPECIES: hypothetical protein [unclassified Clostridium]|uniref:hypothetical protein n=1 Tax=unclassified Clostridium TaxID=2614128 RepID=UPI000297C078|nr:MULTISPECIES: hypothetical protein [unclassified Clostridium]EKQ57342.1 MAG: hypothetical protein A370_00993 [Clostridium sp. Maddingley MBC34-26]